MVGSVTPLADALTDAFILDLQHVSVARGDAIVLHDVSLRLAAGEHLAILGPNGCGKSTLLKALTCELYPLAVNADGGRPVCRIFGRERWDVTQLRQRLGVVSAELPGTPTLTTTSFDAILTGFFASSTLWPNLTVTELMRARAEELLVLVGAERFRDRFVGELSAGQQRRVMIARALAGSRAAAGIGAGVTEMLLLDEPSNALDLRAQQELRELLRGLAQSGVSIVLITHHVADVVPEIGRVLMMREGRVAADGSRVELLTAERLSWLFGVTVQTAERDGHTFAW